MVDARIRNSIACTVQLYFLLVFDKKICPNYFLFMIDLPINVRYSL